MNCSWRNGSSMSGQCERSLMGNVMVGVANLTLGSNGGCQNSVGCNKLVPACGCNHVVYWTPRGRFPILKNSVVYIA